MNYLKNHQPSYSDSYLMSMTKKQLIEHIRILEHNIDVVNEQSENQYGLDLNGFSMVKHSRGLLMM